MKKRKGHAHGSGGWEVEKLCLLMVVLLEATFSEGLNGLFCRKGDANTEALLEVVAHACKSNTRQAGAEDCEFVASLSYIARVCLEIKGHSFIDRS